MPRNVLVTGGGGFLGKAIVKKLVKRGDRVASFSRNRYTELDHLNVEQIQGDLSDKSVVSAACKGMDIIFHVAAKAGVWGPFKEYYQANVVGTQNVLNGCKAHDISTLVYTSSPSVIHDSKSSLEGVDESAAYPDTFPTPYVETKALAEQHVIESSKRNLKTITLRPHLIWGPGDNHLIPRILARAGKIIQVGDGKNRVDTIYIDNAANAHIQAGDALQANHTLSGRVYFISQGKPVYLWDMINDILRAGGKPMVTRSISTRSAYVIGAVMEFMYKMLRIKSEPKMTRFLAHEFSSSHWFDITAARKDWGFNPKITTEQGMKKLKRWLAENDCATD